MDVNGIRLGSNSIMTDKHTAEHSKTACLGIYWPMCDVYIAHTTIKPEVSIALTEMPFLILQVNFSIGTPRPIYESGLGCMTA